MPVSAKIEVALSDWDGQEGDATFRSEGPPFVTFVLPREAWVAVGGAQRLRVRWEDVWNDEERQWARGVEALSPWVRPDFDRAGSLLDQTENLLRYYGQVDVSARRGLETPAWILSELRALKRDLRDVREDRKARALRQLEESIVPPGEPVLNPEEVAKLHDDYAAELARAETAEAQLRETTASLRQAWAATKYWKDVVTRRTTTLRERAERAERVVAAANALFVFLEHEKETFDPCESCVEAGLTSAVKTPHYQREEELTDALGEALRDESVVFTVTEDGPAGLSDVAAKAFQAFIERRAADAERIASSAELLSRRLLISASRRTGREAEVLRQGLRDVVRILHGGIGDQGAAARAAADAADVARAALVLSKLPETTEEGE